MFKHLNDWWAAIRTGDHRYLLALLDKLYDEAEMPSAVYREVVTQSPSNGTPDALIAQRKGSPIVFGAPTGALVAQIPGNY